jgi:hypothetical protein
MVLRDDLGYVNARCTRCRMGIAANLALRVVRPLTAAATLLMQLVARSFAAAINGGRLVQQDVCGHLCDDIALWANVFIADSCDRGTNHSCSKAIGSWRIPHSIVCTHCMALYTASNTVKTLTLKTTRNSTFG